jgi:cytochrome P450 family 9
MSKSVTSFFHSLVHGTISTREQKGIIRPDMIHLLMQARKGTLQVDENGTNNDKITKPSMYDI